MRIPLSAPDVTEAEIEAVAAVMRSAQLSLGPKLGAFETAMADVAGVPDAVAVSSGTAGLHLCLQALGVSEGDEVIVPSFTFIAAANAIRYVGAVPVFVDIEEESLNMSPDGIERTITARTRALIVVHTFGRPADMSRILAIARRHELAVIEDACEAIGAEFEGRRVGSFGDLAVFAFYPNKQITTGEGGVVVTRRAELAAHLRVLRNQGRSPSDDWLQHVELGYNYRLSEINCALGVGQLKRLSEILQRREDVARLYDRHLSGIEGLILPLLDVPGSRISWFVYVVRLDASYTPEDRDSIVHDLQQAGIGCGRYFGPIHLQPAYSAWRNASMLPVTEAQACRTIALPFFNRIGEDQIAEVCAALSASMARLRRVETPFDSGE
jgi:perosamine synthetase